MWTLARKNLLNERARLAISIGGVAFAVALMILLRGFYIAYEHKVGDFYNAMDVDAWVVQKGTADMLHSYSVLPSTLERTLRETDGLAEVIPYMAKELGFKLHGRDVVLYVAGFDPAARGPGPGPLRMEAGRRAIDKHEIIVDKVFAHRNGLQIGERITILDQELEVAGISSGGDVVMFQYGFVTNARARSLLQSKELVNAYLLRFAPGADPPQAMARVTTDFPDTRVKDVAEVIAENERIVKESFLPVLGVLLVIGFCVGVAVIGLTIYSAVLEHRREYGVLKALGARPFQMLMVVGVQALGAAAAGYVGGILLSLLAARAAEVWVPSFITRLVLTDVALVGVAALLMGLIAAVIPMRSILRVDPAVVFRS
jgi:putative ABC transport system permease protein